MQTPYSFNLIGLNRLHKNFEVVRAAPVLLLKIPDLFYCERDHSVILCGIMALAFNHLVSSYRGGPVPIWIGVEKLRIRVESLS